MTEPTATEPSALDVNAAFKSLFTGQPMEPVKKAPEPAPEQPVAAAPAEHAEPETAPATSEPEVPVEATQAETEDVESLKKRLTDREAEFTE